MQLILELFEFLQQIKSNYSCEMNNFSICVLPIHCIILFCMRFIPSINILFTFSKRLTQNHFQVHQRIKNIVPYPIFVNVYKHFLLKQTELSFLQSTKN